MRGLVKVTMLGALAATVAGAANAQPAPASTGSDLFISPMGEPFRGDSSAGQLRAWFNGADSDRNGALSLAEMRADADRFYLVLNLNRDREIDPTELRAYEQAVPEIRVGMGGYGITSGNAKANRSRLSPEYSKAAGTVLVPLDRETSRRGAGRFGVLATPNPVASTDVNFNRGISAEEFARAARDRFVLLDANRDGAIRFEELPALPSRTIRRSR